MTLVKQHPRALNHFLDDFFHQFPYTWGRDTQQSNWSIPAANVHETKDGYHVELSVPGFTKEDFKINVENNILTVSSEKKESKETTENNEYKTIRREYSFRNFKRSFTLDDKINADAIQAKYENGILKMYLPKKEEIKVSPKEITVA